MGKSKKEDKADKVKVIKTVSQSSHDHLKQRVKHLEKDLSNLEAKWDRFVQSGQALPR